MKRRLFSFLTLTFLVQLSTMPVQAQFLKKLGEGLLQGQGQNQGMAGQQGQPAGSTSLPPGQYMMTNMASGQGYYIMVDGNGQMFASIPQGGQQMQNQQLQNQPGAGGFRGALQNLVPGMQQQAGMQQNMTTPGGYQQQQPGMQQQQQGGLGGFMKGTLNNLIQNQAVPQQGYGQQ